MPQTSGVTNFSERVPVIDHTHPQPSPDKGTRCTQDGQHIFPCSSSTSSFELMKREGERDKGDNPPPRTMSVSSHTPDRSTTLASQTSQGGQRDTAWLQGSFRRHNKTAREQLQQQLQRVFPFSLLSSLATSITHANVGYRHRATRKGDNGTHLGHSKGRKEGDPQCTRMDGRFQGECSRSGDPSTDDDRLERRSE